MIGLLQRVTCAQVEIEGHVVAAIDHGLLVLIGVERGDSEQQTVRLLDRILGYRIFADQEGKMNLSVTDINGGLLLVPQFTLPADTKKGMRPSFTPAAAPGIGERLFNYLVHLARTRYPRVEVGRFGAHMRVSSINDGPVTFWLQTAPV